MEVDDFPELATTDASDSSNLGLGLGGAANAVCLRGAQIFRLPCLDHGANF